MVKGNPNTIYWDTSCFVAWFNKEQGRYDTCNAIIEAARKGEIKLLTSWLTLAEIHKITDEYPSEAEDIIAEFFKNPYIIKIAVDWSVTRITRDLRGRFKLAASDGIHLATAIRYKAEAFHTYDRDDLLRLNGHIPGYSLSIIEPDFTYQTEFTT